MKLVAFLLTGAVVATACSSDGGPVAEPVPAQAVSLAALPEGGFLWANINGTVHNELGQTIGSVDADTDGQRGLLGLTVSPDDRVFVSYTDATFALVVSELVAQGDDESAERIEREVWRGPITVQGGNGGRMIFADGELIIGIGLLNDRDGQADPESIVGKLIAIDPDAPSEDQVPRILSGPWNNPFAFDRSPAGELWVADNDPRDGDERLARGDQGLNPEVAVVLPNDSAPSGLAATNDSLYVCSYNDLELLRYEFVDGVLTFAETVATDCVLDVELLSDGDLVYSTGESIIRVSPER